MKVAILSEALHSPHVSLVEFSGCSQGKNARADRVRNVGGILVNKEQDSTVYGGASSWSIRVNQSRSDAEAQDAGAAG